MYPLFLKNCFLEDEVNTNIMGYDWKNRREEVLFYFKFEYRKETF